MSSSYIDQDRKWVRITDIVTESKMDTSNIGIKDYTRYIESEAYNKHNWFNNLGYDFVMFISNIYLDSTVELLVPNPVTFELQVISKNTILQGNNLTLYVPKGSWVHFDTNSKDPMNKGKSSLDVIGLLRI